MLRSFRESDLMVMILICRKDLRSVDRATLTQGILGSGGGGGPEELNLHKPLCEDTSWHFGWKILQEGREESEVEDAQLPSDQRPPTAASVRASVRPSSLDSRCIRPSRIRWCRQKRSRVRNSFPSSETFFDRTLIHCPN